VFGALTQAPGPSVTSPILAGRLAAPVHDHVYDSEQPVCTICGYNPQQLLEEERFRGVPLTQAQARKFAAFVEKHEHSFSLANFGDGWVVAVAYDPDGDEITVEQLPPQGPDNLGCGGFTPPAPGT
jgi:hypothetical protein